MKSGVLAPIAVLTFFATLAASQVGPPLGLHIMVSVIPNITAQPQNQTVIAGQTATFTVTATGDAPLGYQWTFNGLNVGSSSSAYTRANCQLADSGGRVQVSVSNSIGTAQSSSVILNIATNIALRKSYTLSPAPNYSYCTDSGDSSQLTDGLYVSGYFWRQLGTVGWDESKASYSTITFDLGTNKPISGLSFNTAAGTAGVEWPLAIFVCVSGDSNAWSYAGDLTALSSQPTPINNGYAVFRYQTLNLATHGRFVKLLIAQSGEFIFSDEIAIYSGPNSLLDVPLSGQVITNMDDFYGTERLGASLRRRLRNDLAAVTAQLDSVPTNSYGALETELNSISQAIPTNEVKSPTDFTTVFPINDLHSNIFAVQAAVWRATGLHDVVLWQSNRWDMLNPTATPIPGSPVLNVPMMNNEYRADAFNLSNASETNAVVFLSLQHLPGVWSNYVAMYEVPFTDTSDGTPVAAALVDLTPQAGQYQVQIPPGLTTQVWFSFHPTNLSSGSFTGDVLVACSGITNQVPIKLEIYPFTFPSKPTLHLTGWDYSDRHGTYYGITDSNRTAFISLLGNYFVDSPWADSVLWDIGTYNSTGHMTTPPDSRYFDAWVNTNWPHATNYYVMVDVPASFGSDGSFAGFAMGTAAFQQAISDWITWWVGKLAQWSIQPNQLNLLLVDEPHTVSQDNIIIQYATAIHAAQPNVVIWEDPIWANPAQATPALFQVSDVLCVNLAQQWISEGATFTNFYLAQQQAGHQLWFYSTVEKSRLLDPYSYYRAQAWFCWKYGAKGSGFWSFGDAGGTSSWNEYTSQSGGYTPLFLDSNSVTSGKQMEAIREGVEDYEYLRMLRDRVAMLQSQGVTNAVVSSASQLLNTAADQVIGGMTYSSYSWTTLKDRTTADSVRLQILEALQNLASQ